MKRWWMIVTLAAFVVQAATAGDAKKNYGTSPEKAAIGVTWAKKALQGYSMKVWVSNQMGMGLQAWDPLDVPIGDCGIGIGLEYPAGSSSCIEHLYGAGPWIGGIVNGVRRVTEGYNGFDARKEFSPSLRDTAIDRIWQTSRNDNEFDVNFNFGPRLLDRPVNQLKCDDDGDGQVDEDELDGFDNDGDWNPFTGDVGSDGIHDTLESGCLGAYGPGNLDPAQDNFEPTKTNPCKPDPNTGNFPRKNDRTLYTERNSRPDHGEPGVDEDYGARSDKDMYMQATDTNNITTFPGHVPMHVKVFQKTYAWDGDFADGIMPMDYFFINVGQNIIYDVYVGFFADMDVGPVTQPVYYQNDYACYIPDLRTAYIHNPRDRGSTPLGITVLGTPAPVESLKYIFQWFDVGDLATQDSILYAWISGEQFGNQLVKPCQSPLVPNDTRFFFSFGPFNAMNPGDTLKISVALVAGEAVDAGPRNLVSNAQKAIQLYKGGYNTPVIPPSPLLTAEPGFKKVTLRWYPSRAYDGGQGPALIWDDSNHIADLAPDTSWRRIDPPCDDTTAGSCGAGFPCGSGRRSGGRTFEGFRLYRSEDPNRSPDPKTFTLLKQFDIAGDEYEYDVGIESVYVDSNLSRGKRYHYAVTSYSIPNAAVLEIPSDTGVERRLLLTPPSESPPSANRVSLDLTFSPSAQLGEVLAVPNPYRVDRDYTYESGGWEGRANVWTENNRLIKFIHLPPKCTIRIFTLAGDLVATLDHDDPVVGEISWNILSESNRALASGVYIFKVESDFGDQIGKFVLIR